ncbi:hypothetical protein NC653_004552 [Populus alba x Populus x berolinensis]|uniref:Uncharacterized protein n=1 Tax=Populus alba x Populus x berolinensis TaxID=444605 RepID=A0AAD6RUP2_9ROSI|nr:hypothetical protein NC653_004548 [Populus alba x Populus x berolinensis]KAJ7015277.1 hypothetical protein NC653_004552 [Populus alba x Populus x berolinensis]
MTDHHTQLAKEISRQDPHSSKPEEIRQT